MSVLPHPHIGLQTVPWPLAGHIHHRDSMGSDALVRPGRGAGRIPAPPLPGVRLTPRKRL